MAKTRAQKNRAIRQDELRAKLAAGGHLQYAIEHIKKIAALKPGKDAAFKLNKHKTVVELQLRLVNKYLPDLRSTELTGDGGEAIKITEVTRTIINA